MQAFLYSALASAPVIPLIQAEDSEAAVAIARALAAGGIRVVEVVQRTPAAPDCIEAIADSEPALVVGAGTVLTGRQAEMCIDRGARFIVSPGLDAGLVEAVRHRAVDMLPGIMTPSEALHAIRLGLDTVKFFPAATAGGPAAIGAIAAALPSLRFVPTGGISRRDLGDYLSLPAVVACGGSWLAPRDLDAAGDLAQVTELARDALALAVRAKQGDTEA